MTANKDVLSGVSLSRRRLLQGAAGFAGLSAIGMPGIVLSAQQQYPAIGTYPKGVQGKEVFVGITQPLSGAYSAAGQDVLYGNELAIKQLNSGELAERMPELKGPGVLGKKIVYDVADTETSPNPAVQAATRFINDNNAIMITGCFSSGTAVALQQLAQQEKVIYMCGPSGSNATTGEYCRRYGFRSQQSAYMASKALAPVLARELGKDLKAAYLVADYTFGHTFFDSMNQFTSEYGWQPITKQLFPIGEVDYSPYLLNIANSGADVLINLGAGGDLISSTTQVQQFGLLERMKYVVPNIGPFMAEGLGAELMGGVYGTMDFWWGLRDQYPLAKFFVDEFEKVHSRKPRWSAHEGYQQIVLWAVALNRAGTFYPPEVIKALESEKPVDTTLGEVYYRAGDHQLVRPVPVVVGKKPDQMSEPEDYYDVVAMVPGEDTLIPLQETGCDLGPYT